MLSHPCILPLVHLCLEMAVMRQDHVTCSRKQEYQGWASLSWDWPGSRGLSRTEAATSPPACFNRTSGLHAKVLIWRASVRPKHRGRMSHTCSLKLHYLIAEAFREGQSCPWRFSFWIPGTGRARPRWAPSSSSFSSSSFYFFHRRRKKTPLN